MTSFNSLTDVSRGNRGETRSWQLADECPPFIGRPQVRCACTQCSLSSISKGVVHFSLTSGLPAAKSETFALFLFFSTARHFALFLLFLFLLHIAFRRNHHFFSSTTSFHSLTLLVPLQLCITSLCICISCILLFVRSCIRHFHQSID